MVSLSDYLIFAAILFIIGIAGIVLNKKNIITMLMSIEIVLLAVNTNFIAFADFYHNTVGEVFVFFILTVAAAEAAIGLAIMIAVFRSRKSIDVNELDSLKG